MRDPKQHQRGLMMINTGKAGNVLRVNIRNCDILGDEIRRKAEAKEKMHTARTQLLFCNKPVWE